MKKIFSILAVSSTVFLTAQIAPVAPNKAKLIEKVTTNGVGKPCIAYEKYVLPNGLTLLVHEDHSDPIAHVDVTYHVGSAREQDGRSGFAHFFEHMMFQGSEHVGDEQHFKMVTEAGGTMNGTTNNDRTNYFETVPANYLEMALWLEADRMGFLLDSVTQKKFEIQRSTVKNERGQNYDNAPYGLLWEKIGEAMYPVGHPYSWQTIGYIEDLNRVNVQDLKNFFMRWYGPNNATVTVAGDVNTADVVKLVEKYFGTIKRGPAVTAMPKAPVTLDKNRCISYEDNVRMAQLSLAWPGVYSWHEDEAALDVLSSIIGDGKSSVFYETFVESEIAERASMFSSTSELAGQIMVNIRAYPGHSLREIDSLVNVAFAKFEKRGVTDDDLQRFKIYIETYMIDQMLSVGDKASTLAYYQTFFGNANLVNKDMERYQRVTKEDVMRVYNKYIKNKAQVCMSIYPKGKVDKARLDNFTPPKRNTDTPEASEYKNLSYVHPTDFFDRSKKPVAGATPVVKSPALWRNTSGNGLRMIGTQSTEVPRTFMMLSISAGHRQENPEQAGIAYLMVKMLDQSTEKREASEIEKQFELLGSEVSISSDNDEIQVYVSALTRNLDATLALVEEKLFHPKFDQQEFDLMKKQQLESVKNMSIQPVSMANLVFNRMVYGENHIMALPSIGTQETVSKLTIEDVKAYYKKMMSPNIARLVVVSDVPKEKMLPKLTFLDRWASTGVSLKTEAELGTPPAGGPTTIYLFNKDKAAQSEIRVGRLGMTYNATGEYYQATVMNYMLGGNFNSRINLKLREEKGWTYGARSGFGGTNYTGTFVASAGVRWDASDSSIVEFVNVIRDYGKSGPTAQELEYTKKAMSQSEALRYEEPLQKLFFLKRILDYNLADDYTIAQNQALQNMNEKDADALAKKWLDPDHMVVAVVGDKARIGDKLAKLGYNVVEVDATGKPMPTTVKEEPKKEEPKPNPPVEETKKKKTKKSKKRTRGAKYDEITK